MSTITFVRIVPIITIMLFGIHCKKEPPIVPPDPPNNSISIKLSIEEVGLNEAWIRINKSDSIQSQAVRLKRNRIEISTFSIVSKDTIFLDTTVLPQRTYEYIAYGIENGKVKDSSNTLTLQTMDTTSHNFNWEVHTVGYQSSIVHDIAIINDTLIYAVGRFYEKDSSVSTQSASNIAVWNGKKWSFKRVLVEIPIEPPFPPAYAFSELYSVSIINENTLLFSDRSDVLTIWNRTSDSVVKYYHVPISIQTTWISNKGEIFGAGVNGTIVLNNAYQLIMLDSMNHVLITDIYGKHDGSDVWFTGYSLSGKCEVLRYSNGVLNKIYDMSTPKPGDFLTWYIGTVWIGKYNVFLPSASGVVHKFSFIKSTASVENAKLQYFPYSIRGTGENNILLLSEYANLYHFNGSTWKHLGDIMNLNIGPYGGVELKNKTAAIGGIWRQGFSRNGIVIIGKQLQ